MIQDATNRSESQAVSSKANLHLVDAAYALALLGLCPMVWLECVSMWNQKHLQFFPVAWIAFGGLVYHRAGGLEFATGQFRWLLGAGIALVSLLAAATSIYISSFWFAYLSALTLMTSWLILRCGKLPIISALALTGLLFVTLRFPSGYDTDMIRILQYQSSRLLGAALDGIGIVNLPSGNVFEIVGKRLFVDEACSGVDSLYALLASSIFILLLYKTKPLVALMALPLVFVWASLGNFIRLLLIVVGYQQFGVDLSTGTAHTILGLFSFLVSFGCDLCFITFAHAVAEGTGKPKKIVDRLVSHFRPSLKIVSIAAFLFAFTYCCFGAFAARGLRGRSLQSFPSIPRAVVDGNLVEGLLPENLGDWKRQYFQVVEREADNTMGHFSGVWMYSAPNNTRITVSTDFPFRGFHRLDFCYTSSGWEIASELMRVKLKDDPSISLEVREMRNQQGQNAFLVYALFEADGTPAPWKGVSIRGLERLEQSILDPITYQIQIHLESDQKISDIQREAAIQNFAVAVKSLKGVFSSLSTGN